MNRPTLVLLCGLAVLFGCARKQPSVPLTPYADFRDDSLCFATSATDPRGLTVQYIFDWGGATTSTGFFASGETVWCSHAFADTGTRHIKVKAKNDAGIESDWSSECIYRATLPPSLTDTIGGRIRWAVDRWYPLKACVTDPDGDSVAAKFIWSDSSGSGTWTQYVASGDTVRDSVKWTTTGARTVRVLLKDKGNTVARPTVTKSVNVSQMAVLWETIDDGNSYEISPVIGALQGSWSIYTFDDCINQSWDLSGHLRWSSPCNGGYCAPSLSTDGARLYDVDNGEIRCVDAATGGVIWTLGSTIFGEDAATVGPSGEIYVPGYESFDCELFRLRDDGDSAHVDWRVPLGDYSSNTAVIGDDGTVYVTGMVWNHDTLRLYAITPQGAVAWIDSLNLPGTGSLNAPVIDNQGRIIVVDGNDERLHCFNPDGSLAWHSEVSGEFYGSGLAVSEAGYIYAQNPDGLLYCVDPSGRSVWYKGIECGGYTTPCIAADGTVIVGSSAQGMLYGFSPDGMPLWSFSIFDSVDYYKHVPRRAGRDEGDEEGSPTIGPDGNVYVASSEVGVFCIACGNIAIATAGWPTYNHDVARSGWVGRH